MSRSGRWCTIGGGTRRPRVFSTIGCFCLLSHMTGHFATYKDAEINSVVILFAVSTERFGSARTSLGDVHHL